jgi:hypothetical protein
VSQDLVDTLETQITDAVGRAWWGRVAEVEGASRILREAFLTATTTADRERILMTSATSFGTLSWLLAIPDEGEIIAVEEVAPDRLRLFRTDQFGHIRHASELGRGSQARHEIDLESAGTLTLSGQAWLDQARLAANPTWMSP